VLEQAREGIRQDKCGTRVGRRSSVVRSQWWRWRSAQGFRWRLLKRGEKREETPPKHNPRIAGKKPEPRMPKVMPHRKKDITKRKKKKGGRILR